MKHAASFIAIIALTGCETTYPDFTLDSEPMRLAAVINFDDKIAVREIIETATPYPLPGQLKLIEEQEAPPPSLKPFQRIDTANERAKIEPDLSRFVNAVSWKARFIDYMRRLSR